MRPSIRWIVSSISLSRPLIIFIEYFKELALFEMPIVALSTTATLLCGAATDVLSGMGVPKENTLCGSVAAS
jgi:hypothetical protein